MKKRKANYKKKKAKKSYDSINKKPRGFNRRKAKHQRASKRGALVF